MKATQQVGRRALAFLLAIGMPVFMQTLRADESKAESSKESAQESSSESVKESAEESSEAGGKESAAESSKGKEAAGKSDLPPVAAAEHFDESKADWAKHKNEPVELEWFVAYDWATANFDPAGNLFDKDLFDRTGVKIKWSIGDQQKLATLIATDALPDLVTYDMNSNERLTLEKDGKLLALDTLRDQYAPNYRPPKGMEDWYRAKDGHWYAHASYFYDIKEMKERGGYLVSHNMNFARFDIMKELGIKAEDMQTKDGFIDALKKFKDSGYKYKDLKMYPFVGNDVMTLAEQFGLDREDKDGHLLNPMRQPEYAEAYLYLNRIYREGLMSDEVFTMDKTQQQQLTGTGAVFAGFPHVFLLGKQQLYEQDHNALMGGIGYIKGDSGKAPIVTPSPTGGWTGTMIPKKCKNPERAIQLFSYLNQADSHLARGLGFGWKGYELVDGKAKPQKERLEELAADPQAQNLKYNSTATDFFCDWVTVLQYQYIDPDNAYLQDQEHYTKTWAEGHMYDDKIFSNVQPEAGSDLAVVAQKLEDYFKPIGTEIIMAGSEEEAKSLLENAIKEMDGMGMKDLDAYKDQRFQENKKKMGVKFAWPRNDVNASDNPAKAKEIFK